jgi:hypothetical protein
MPLNMMNYKDPKATHRMYYWQALGFLQCPTLEAAKGTERLYRSWGGTSRELSEEKTRDGQFLSFHKPKTRREAEKFLSVMEYGNQLLWVTEFRVKAGTPLWIGQLHPGADAKFFGNIPGSQVFLEREWENNLSRVKCDRISNDMPGVSVIRKFDPGKDMSS